MDRNARIVITENGPYLVSGGVPLTEKIIQPAGNVYILKEGRALPQADEYALCRCGRSRNAPFCDSSHLQAVFDGTETAAREPYEARAEILSGPAVDLQDDDRCAFARFCYQERGTAWQLTMMSDDPECKAQAIQGASDCHSGRLTAMEKNGQAIEPEYAPGIGIVQDPEQGTSAGIYVKGYIPIESSDGEVYEVRNRVALCRCGRSENKPFCNASHIAVKYTDR